MLTALTDILWQSWLVLGQMAPYLLLGFLIAGILSVAIPASWVERWLGRPGMMPVLTASVIGVPLPLCSCGVIPVGASIRRHGASRAATASFLLSTPQTGVDSVLVTYGMMGPVLAVFRPVVALLTGLIGGAMVLLIGEREKIDALVGEPADEQQPGDTQSTAQQTAESSCCATKCCSESPAGPSADPVEQTTCCHDGPGENALIRVLRYGFVTLPRDLANSLLIGVLLAGLIAALVPPGEFREYFGGGLLSILVMMAAAIPVYVCATASVPLAVGLIYAGVSPGAALAFLIAGPATNAATVATIWRVLGRSSTVAYLLTVAVSAVVAGLLLNFGWPDLADQMPAVGSAAHLHEAVTPWTHAWAVAMLAVLGLSYWRGGK